jgi:hypothetical protein
LGRIGRAIDWIDWVVAAAAAAPQQHCEHGADSGVRAFRDDSL